MKTLFNPIAFTFLFVLLFSLHSFGQDIQINEEYGKVTLASNLSVEKTVKNLEIIILEKGLHHFTTIDHSQGAASVDMELRPTVLIIFGNPKAGTQLMQKQQVAGLDLPMKYLVWEDERGNVWITYTLPDYIAARHDVTDLAPLLAKMTALLKAMATRAAN